MAAPRKEKQKNLHALTCQDWNSLLDYHKVSPLLSQILENENRSDNFLVQLGSSLRNGVLSKSSTLRADLLSFFERNCVELCRGSDTNRIRWVYEAIREHIGNPFVDGPQLSTQLRDNATKSLTRVIISLEIPQKDPRLIKFHVEHLFRLLDPLPNSPSKSDTITSKNAMSDRRLLAAECLQMLESAFPTLLSLESYAFLQLAKKEASKPTPGFVCTQLAATVLSNAAEQCIKQREHHKKNNATSQNSRAHADMLLSTSSPYSSSTSSATKHPHSALILGHGMDGLEDATTPDNISPRDVMSLAADILLDSTSRGFPNYTLLDGDEDDSNDRDGDDAMTESSSIENSTLNTQRNNNAAMEKKKGKSSLRKNRSVVSPSTTNTCTVAVSTSTVLKPTSLHLRPQINDISSDSSTTATFPLIPAANMKRNDESCSVTCRNESYGSRKSALTAAIRTSSMESGVWTATSSPRSFSHASGAETVPLLHLVTDCNNNNNNNNNNNGNGTETIQLRRFRVPLHIQTGDENDAPIFLICDDAQCALQDAVFTFLNGMRRFDPGAIARVCAALPPLLRLASPLPATAWPYFDRLLNTGSVPLLRAVLNIRDAVPQVFEGRDPCLVERILSHVNDPELTQDHRITAASWILRQHAAQRHAGGDLLLADCWEQLLPRGGPGREPVQLAMLKFKALASCLASGIGDEEVVCRAVCSWDGFAGVRPTEQQLRTMTFAMRTLLSAAVAGPAGEGDRGRPDEGDNDEEEVVAAAGGEEEGEWVGTTASTVDGTSFDTFKAPNAPRLIACLITGMLEALVDRPQLAPAVDALLETCPHQSFVDLFLKSLNALFSTVDGQFEALRERLEDSFYQGTPDDVTSRVKAAVLSRSASLSGMLRGLSFRLSFTKRMHSTMGMMMAPPPSSLLPSSSSSLLRRSSSVALPSPTEKALSRSTVYQTEQKLDVRALRSSIIDAFQHQPHMKKQDSYNNTGTGDGGFTTTKSAAATPRGAGPSSGSRVQTPRLSVSLAQQQQQQQQQHYVSKGGIHVSTPRGRSAVASTALQSTNGDMGFNAATPFTTTTTGKNMTSSYSRAVPVAAAASSSYQPNYRENPSVYRHQEEGEQQHGGGGGEEDLDFYGYTPHAVPAVPFELPDWGSAESWLVSSATWEPLAPGILQHDLMAYRSLMQRALRAADIHPRGTLRTLANYTWQYKEAHPSHCLTAKETAAAILALCQTAALAHLPCPKSAGGWSARQSELADSVQSVLDAIEEGFPVPSARSRSQILGNLMMDEGAWAAQHKASTLAQILSGYMDAAIAG